MIRIDRTAGVAACAALARTDRFGLTETDYALWHFAGIVPDKPNLPASKRPTFKAYKSKPVIAELTAMFGPKCAYCETVYANGGPMDVEHYRPKGGYIDDKGIVRAPGYFWLAASWDNLFASCTDCNRQRRLKRRANGKYVTAKSGKGNLFPIAPDSTRAIGPAGVAAEVPLLLNPCQDFPERHLKFRSDGFVDPSPSPYEAALPKGRTTIEVCGLEREDLRTERRELVSLLSAQMQAVLVCDRHLVEAPNSPFNLADLAAAEGALAAFGSSGRPYQALVREMMRTFEIVRPIARAYHGAYNAWIASESPEDRAALIDQVAAVSAAIARPDVDRNLADMLFGATRVVAPAA